MNKRCTVYVDDEVSARILGLHPEDAQVLWEKFGFFADGYFHMPLYQLRRWDGKIRFFDKTGKTYARLLPEILPYLAAWNYECDLVDARKQTIRLDPAPTIDENIFGTEFKLRPYQVEVVNALLQEGSGFAICATGSGKTSMCAALSLVLNSYGLQVLVIVPSVDLVKQTADEFRERLREYPLRVGEFSGSEKNIDCPIVVATWQSLQNATHYMAYFNAVIVDEAHGAKAQVIRDLINNHGKHISYRYGCTGTFPKGEVDQYSLKLSIGNIVREVPASYLIKLGYLAEIEIQPVETIDEDPEVPDYAAERAYLTGHDERTQAIAEEVKSFAREHGNTLVLVNQQSLAMGRLLNELIDGSVYLDGKSKSDLRAEEYARYAQQDGITVIASAGIASTGISIDRIFCLVLLDTGKSFTKCIQSVGRGMRRAGDKNKVFVVDIYSKLKYAKKHFKERKKYYDEAGYPINVVNKLKY